MARNYQKPNKQALGLALNWCGVACAACAEQGAAAAAAAGDSARLVIEDVVSRRRSLNEVEPWRWCGSVASDPTGSGLPFSELKRSPYPCLGISLLYGLSPAAMHVIVFFFSFKRFILRKWHAWSLGKLDACHKLGASVETMSTYTALLHPLKDQFSLLLWAKRF